MSHEMHRKACFLKDKSLETFQTMTWMLGIVGIICLVGGAWAGESSAEDVAGRLSPEEFIILPWGWTPGREDLLLGIKECGFNRD